MGFNSAFKGLIEVIRLAVTFQTRICSIFIQEIEFFNKMIPFLQVAQNALSGCHIGGTFPYFDRLWEMLNSVQHQKFQLHYSKNFFLRADVHLNI